MDFDFSIIEGFEWDDGNSEHIKKHKINPKEAEQIFFNKPLLLKKDEKHSQVEQRFQALGLTSKDRYIFISYTIRNNRIRIISARDQNKKERIDIQKIGGEKNEKVKENSNF